MIQKTVGRTDLAITSIGLGCVTFGREIDEDTSTLVLDYALEKGITFFDTAEGYGGGNSQESRRATGIDDQREVTTEMSSSEQILGRWLKKRGCGDQIVLCTKVSSGNRPDNIRKQVAASLDRLGVTCIDIYKLHKWEDDVPIDETLDALNEQVQAGAIKVIGCSNFSVEHLQASLDAGRDGQSRFEITQPPYNLADRSAEAHMFDLCRREQIAVTPYSPLAAGFLAGKYTPDRSQFPKGTRFDIAPAHADVYFSDRNFRIVEQLREKAKALDIPMVRLAMAWAMAHPDITAVLVGARKREHIDNALSAAEMGLDASLRDEMSAWE